MCHMERCLDCKKVFESKYCGLLKYKWHKKKWTMDRCKSCEFSYLFKKTLALVSSFQSRQWEREREQHCMRCKEVLPCEFNPFLDPYSISTLSILCLDCAAHNFVLDLLAE